MDTIECLESVYQNIYPNFSVILVDNNSSDESVLKIIEYCEGKIPIKSNYVNYLSQNKPIHIIDCSNAPQNCESCVKGSDQPVITNNTLILIRNSENFGYSEGNNIAIKLSLDVLQSDFILLLNNDTVVDKEFLIEMMKLAQSDDKIGMVGCKGYFYNNNGHLQFTGGALAFDIKKMKGTGVWGKPDSHKYDTDFDVANISGSCLLCKRGVIDAIGLLDSDYYLYWEDADWSYRARTNGYRLMYAHKSIVWHKGSASSGSKYLTYYNTRNKFLFIKKHGTFNERLYFYISFFLSSFWIELFNITWNYRDFELFIYLKAVIHGFLGIKSKTI